MLAVYVVSPPTAGPEAVMVPEPGEKLSQKGAGETDHAGGVV